jgi:hypothetical protein
MTASILSVPSGVVEGGGGLRVAEPPLLKFHVDFPLLYFLHIA